MTAPETRSPELQHGDGRMRADLEALTADLIRIDSVNVGLVPGGAGEGDIADFVTDWLSARGFQCVRLERNAGRPSVVGIARGTGSVAAGTASAAGEDRGRTLMLNGHLDTVSLTTYADGAGLQPRIVDGRLYGRGAYDMKGGVAAVMLAAARAAEGELRRGDIVVALVADEEDVSGGTEEVLDHLRAEGIRIDAAVVPEPTDEVVMPAHRGFVWAEVTVRGVAAHGSRPDLGVDAIVRAGAFLTALGGLGERLAAGPRTPLLGTGSVHASLISGGAEVSSYPDACTVTLERRTVPGEDAAFVEAELREIVDELAARDPEFSAEVRVTFERPPFDAGEDSAVVPVVREAYAQVTGREAEVTGMQAWTDCALLAEAGIDAVLFGPVGAGAHAAEEWVSLDSLVTLSRVLERTVREFTA